MLPGGWEVLGRVFVSEARGWWTLTPPIRSHLHCESFCSGLPSAPVPSSVGGQRDRVHMEVSLVEGSMSGLCRGPRGGKAPSESWEKWPVGDSGCPRSLSWVPWWAALPLSVGQFLQRCIRLSLAQSTSLPRPVLCDLVPAKLPSLAFQSQFSRSKTTKAKKLVRETAKNPRPLFSKAEPEFSC